MLIDGRVKKALNFDDINSLVSFRDWLKNNLTLYEKDQKVNDNHFHYMSDLDNHYRNIGDP